MILEYIRYSMPEPARQAELVQAYRNASKSLDAAPECLAYELSACEEDPSSFVLRIEWESTQGHLEGFRNGPHFRPFLAAIGEFVKDIAEMRHYRLTEIARRK